MTPAEPTSTSLRAAFGRFPSGIAAICAEVAGRPVGMAVSTFVPVSLSPPLIAVCLQRISRTWPVLRSRSRVGVSVLAGHHESAAHALASRDGDRFAAVSYTVFPAGDLAVDGCAAYFACSLADEVDAGDHVLALLRVHRIQIDDAATDPLVFHRSRFARLAVPAG